MFRNKTSITMAQGTTSAGVCVRALVHVSVYACLSMCVCWERRSLGIEAKNDVS